MFLTITFPNANENLEARIQHNLPHAHKQFPVLKHCIRQINPDSQTYYLKNDNGETVAECHFQIDGNQLSFTLFKGKWKKDLQKMLKFHLVEDLAEKARIHCEDSELYYDLDNFFLVEKDRNFKIGTDYESIIAVDIKHIPLEIRHL